MTRNFPERLTAAASESIEEKHVYSLLGLPLLKWEALVTVQGPEQPIDSPDQPRLGKQLSHGVKTTTHLSASYGHEVCFT